MWLKAEDVEREIQSWIEWSRANLPAEGDIPPLDWLGPDITPDGGGSRCFVPWESFYSDSYWMPEREKPIELRKEILNCFGDRLISNPRDLPVRYTALHFYHSAATFETPMKEEEVNYLRRAFVEDFRTVITLLPADNCPAEWRLLKWEILNACLIEDWDRASELYDLVERSGVLEGAELYATRGHFNFLVTFGVGPNIELFGQRSPTKPFERVLNSPEWEPKLVAKDTPAGLGAAFTLYEIAVSTLGFHRQFPVDLRNRVRDGRTDLEKALDLTPELHMVYRAMLARCCFALEDFTGAAKCYAALLKSETALTKFDLKRIDLVKIEASIPTEGLSEEERHKRFVDAAASALAEAEAIVQRDFKPEIFRCLAESYARAGKLSDAEGTLEAWAAADPENGEPYFKLAALHAERADYKGAYEHLRKASARDPIGEDDLATKVALALGALHSQSDDFAKVANQVLEKRPEMSGLLDSLNRELWPRFQNLSDQSRKEWLSAILLIYYFPSLEPSKREVLVQNGAALFAKVVEREIRLKIFLPFAQLRRNDQAGGPKSDPQNITADRLRKPQRLTLGDMYHCLEDSLQSSAGLLHMLKSWVGSRYPTLLRNIALLRDLVNLRNPATHDKLEFDQCFEVARISRSLLETVLV